MKYILLLSYLLLSLFFSSLYAVPDITTGATLYASNNSAEISPKQALHRLIEQPQKNLQKEIIKSLQLQHIQQGHFYDALGLYVMSRTGHQTADNTNIFAFSPYQKIAVAKIFKLSQQLAILLNQDSIAVFIPDVQAGENDVTVKFDHDSPLLVDVMKKISKMLPANYSGSYSIILENTPTLFKTARVASIEWLGEGISKNTLHNVFPQTKVHAVKGDAFLVFQSGKIQKL